MIRWHWIFLHVIHMICCMIHTSRTWQTRPCLWEEVVEVNLIVNEIKRTYLEFWWVKCKGFICTLVLLNTCVSSFFANGIFFTSYVYPYRCPSIFWKISVSNLYEWELIVVSVVLILWSLSLWLIDTDTLVVLGHKSGVRHNNYPNLRHREMAIYAYVYCIGIQLTHITLCFWLLLKAAKSKMIRKPFILVKKVHDDYMLTYCLSWMEELHS